MEENIKKPKYFRRCRSCGLLFDNDKELPQNCSRCGTEPGDESTQPLLVEEWFGEHLLYRIEGGYLRISDLECLKERVELALVGPLKSLAFCFDHAYLDSSTLNFLVKTAHALLSGKRKMYLITSNRQMIDAMEAVSLDGIVQMLPDKATYLAKIAG